MRLIERLTWFHVLLISVVGAVLVGAIVHFTRPGAYVASTTLLLNDRPDLLAGMASATGGAGDPGPSLARIQAILVSREIRSRIVKELGLAELFDVPELEAQQVLLEMTSLKTIGDDGIDITVTAYGYARPRLAILGYPVSFERARSLCAEIANAYPEQLRSYLREQNLEYATGTKQFLDDRYKELSSDLEDTRDRLQSLRAQYELLDPDSKATRLSERIRMLEQSRADAIAEADAAASSLTAAEAELSEMETRRVASAVETRNPVIASLEQDLAGLRIDLATELAKGKTAQNRDVVQIQSAIDSIQQQIDDLEDTVIREVGEQPNPLHDATIQRVVELRVQLAGAKARRSEHERLLAAARREMAQMPAVAREYVEIERRQQLETEELASVERALWLAEIEEARANAVQQFSVLDVAAPPLYRRGPTTLLSAGIAFVALMLLQGLLIIDRRWFGG